MTVAIAPLIGRPIEPKPRAADLLDTYPKGRRCAMPGCDTVLSIYNPNETCWIDTKRLQQAIREAGGRRRR